MANFTPDEVKKLAGAGVLATEVGRTGLTVGVILDRLYAGATADRAQITALTAAVEALAKGSTGPQVVAAIQEAVAKLKITLQATP